MEVSAADGTNVDEAFMALAQQLYEQEKNNRESMNAGSSSGGQNFNSLVDLNEKPPATKPVPKKWCIV